MKWRRSSTRQAAAAAKAPTATNAAASSTQLPADDAHNPEREENDRLRAECERLRRDCDELRQACEEACERLSSQNTYCEELFEQWLNERVMQLLSGREPAPLPTHLLKGG